MTTTTLSLDGLDSTLGDPAHYLCWTRYRDNKALYSLCGKPLLGIPATGNDIKCFDCITIMVTDCACVTCGGDC